MVYLFKFQVLKFLLCQDIRNLSFLQVIKHSHNQDLNYDDRIRRYLLNRINGIGADALIYNDSLSDSTYTYFDAISYNRHDNLNPLGDK